MHGRRFCCGDLLRAQVLLDREREVGAALHGRVVRDDHALAALDDADPGDDPGRRRLAVVDVPRGERVQLEEGRARVDEPVDPLARRQLAARAVALDRSLAAAAARPGRCARAARRRAPPSARGGARTPPSPVRQRLRARPSRVSVQPERGRDELPALCGGVPRKGDTRVRRRSRLANRGDLRPLRAAPLQSCFRRFPHNPQGGVNDLAGPEPAPGRDDPRPAPPGEFVSPEFESGCARFLDEVKSMVERRTVTPSRAVTPAPEAEQ